MKLGQRCGRRNGSRATVGQLRAPDLPPVLAGRSARAAAEISALLQPDPVADWSGRITQAWQQGTANTLELARLVSQARTSLEEHGQWTHLFDSNLLPFKKRKADRLVRIGRTFESESANESIWTHLPSSWLTLYYLARLGRPLARQLVAQGRIHSRLTLREAKALLAEFEPGTMVQRVRRRPFKERLARFEGFLRRTAANWSSEERRLAHAELLRLAAQFESVPDAEGGSVAPRIKVHSPSTPKPTNLNFKSLTNSQQRHRRKSTCGKRL